MSTEKDSLSYVHPWCGKTFSIERGVWDFEASPQMCCVEHCEVDPDSCDVAKKNWQFKWDCTEVK